MARFTNQAQLTYGTKTVSSNIAVGNLIEALSVTKNAVFGSYTQNRAVTYVVNLVNSGTAALTNLTITDNLGGYTFNGNTLYPLDYTDGTVSYYVNGVLQATPTVTAGPPLVISGISVPVGGNVTLIYETTLNGYAPMAEGSTIVNTATVSGSGITSVNASETITASLEPDLAIIKSLEPVNVSENGTLTYTFVIQNYGNSEAVATTGIAVADTFNPVLSNITVTLDGTALTAGTDYTYDTNTGAFSTTAGVITVPAATYSQNEASGAFTVNPGTVTLVVSGTV